MLFRSHISEHRNSLAKVKTSFGEDKVLSPIGVDIKLAKQFESGSPIILDEKRSKGMRDYRVCIEELLQKI